MNNYIDAHLYKCKDCKKCKPHISRCVGNGSYCKHFPYILPSVYGEPVDFFEEKEIEVTNVYQEK